MTCKECEYNKQSLVGRHCAHPNVVAVGFTVGDVLIRDHIKRLDLCPLNLPPEPTLDDIKKHALNFAAKSLLVIKFNVHTGGDQADLIESFLYDAGFVRDGKVTPLGRKLLEIFISGKEAF